ncbi:MAG: L-fucose mutarotase [Candidatus Latescibacterota bacterium]
MALLCRMGQGDEIVLADAHFPGHSCNERTLRADGLKIDALLEAILPLFALNTYVESPAFVMEAVVGDTFDPAIRETYAEIVGRHWPEVGTVAGLERFSFYERTQQAFAVVMTGDVAKYSNIILKKGVTPAQ